MSGSERQPHDPELVAAFELSQRLGMLGGRPIPEVIDHSLAFVAPLEALEPGALVVDLGSGGGVPGLVIAWLRPDLRVVLVDRRATRADHLHRLVMRLGVSHHVGVLPAEASGLPRLLEGRAAGVVARGFGPPRSLLAAAVPILDDDGLIVVAEPPQGDAGRWSAGLLAEFGLRRDRSEDTRVSVLRQHARRSS